MAAARPDGDGKEMKFVPGLKLNQLYYSEVVGPLLKKYDPELRYSAALIGYGSDVLGFDNATSMDHNWGPRMQLFLSGDDSGRVGEIDQYLRHNLPGEFLGFSTNYTAKRDDGTQTMCPKQNDEVNHLIEICELDGYFAGFLRKDPTRLSSLDWLCIPEQRLVELTAGLVFYDGLARLNELRSLLRYYPQDVKLIKLAAYWQCIANEEAFIGRGVELGDLLHVKLVSARLVNSLLKICFVLKETYVPYSKWFSRAFERLDLPQVKTAALRVLHANDPKEIEDHWAELCTLVLDLQNHTPGIPAVTNEIGDYYKRPYKVIMAGAIVDELRQAIGDEQLRALDLALVGLDNKNDAVDFTNDDYLGKIIKQ
jgi:hypothetical protein